MTRFWIPIHFKICAFVSYNKATICTHPVLVLQSYKLTQSPFNNYLLPGLLSSIVLKLVKVIKSNQ